MRGWGSLWANRDGICAPKRKSEEAEKRAVRGIGQAAGADNCKGGGRSAAGTREENEGELRGGEGGSPPPPFVLPGKTKGIWQKMEEGKGTLGVEREGRPGRRNRTTGPATLALASWGFGAEKEAS